MAHAVLRVRESGRIVPYVFPPCGPKRACDIPAAVIIIVLLATTPRSDMHRAEYVFGSAGVVNQTGGWNTGIAFLFGLLSVQWTVR